ncbi:hypothetical protein PU560_12930 [Georgenia sp. 10Sc9-8]|uniref:Histidine kinase n=1 Tax=Georgenia halotolerans TaxID=3028317 RepID=A0ABT5TZ69_9MICO|nr:hypothetical protein [Georgenia halotolerans]
MTGTLWFVVWAVLVAGALLVLALLMWRLWRRARALGAELQRATELTAALDDHTATLTSAGPTVPGVVADPVTLARAHGARGRVRAARQARRGRRLARATERWRALRLLP